MIQVNLLPDVKKEYIHAQRTKGKVISFSIIITIASVGLAVFFFLVVFLVQPGLISASNNEIKKKTTDLKAVPNVDKNLTIQNQLKSLPTLHDSKLIYSRLFAYLKTLNPAAPNNVSLATLEVNTESKEISLSGATKNFQAFKVFQDTLKNATITYKVNGVEETENLFESDSIQVENQTLTKEQGKEQLGFTMRVKYKENAFSPKVTDAQLKVDEKDTTQSAVFNNAAVPKENGGSN